MLLSVVCERWWPLMKNLSEVDLSEVPEVLDNFVKKMYFFLKKGVVRLHR